MSARDTCVLIPMKRFVLAKTRLRARRDPAERAKLGRAMFERVLHAANGHETWVLTNGDDVAQLARQLGSHVLEDPPPPLTAAEGTPTTTALGSLVDWGLRELAARGVRRALVLMADLPLIEPEDVAQLSAALEGADLAATSDRRGHSTNALALRLPFAARTAFGDPRSYALHLRRARALGLRALEVPNERIAHDVDIPDDLPAMPEPMWRSSLPGEPPGSREGVAMAGER
jgi:2-phospho-L-lactate guanylyltransferase